MFENWLDIGDTKEYERAQKNIIKDKIVVLIPARGGSKRIKSKNLYMIGNRPLIAWSIEAAKKEKIIDKVYVSTDDKNISFYAKHYGAQIHKREKNILRIVPLFTKR